MSRPPSVPTRSIGVASTAYPWDRCNPADSRRPEPLPRTRPSATNDPTNLARPRPVPPEAPMPGPSEPTAARLLVDRLVDGWGVRHIFGLPGDAITGILGAIRE